MEVTENFCSNCGELLGSRPATSGQKVGAGVILGAGVLLFFVGLRTMTAMARLGDAASPVLLIMAIVGMIITAVGGLMLGRMYRKSMTLSIVAVIVICVVIVFLVGPVHTQWWGARWGAGRC